VKRHEHPIQTYYASLNLLIITTNEDTKTFMEAQKKEYASTPAYIAIEQKVYNKKPG